MSKQENNEKAFASLEQLQSSGVKHLQLMKKNNILTLIREELSQRLGDENSFTPGEIQELSNEALKEFQLLLRHSLTQEHSISQMSVELNHENSRGARDDPDPFYVLHYGENNRKQAHSFFSGMWNR